MYTHFYTLQYDKILIYCSGVGVGKTSAHREGNAVVIGSSDFCNCGICGELLANFSTNAEEKNPSIRHRAHRLWFFIPRRFFLSAPEISQTVLWQQANKIPYPLS